MLYIGRADAQISGYKMPILERASLMFNSWQRTQERNGNKMFNLLCYIIFRCYINGQQRDIF